LKRADCAHYFSESSIRVFAVSKKVYTSTATILKSILYHWSRIMELIKVAATSRTAAVAGAIAGTVRDNHRAEVQAIGAGAVNQAVKALILAISYLRLDGIEVAFVPEFADVLINDQMRTAIKLVVEIRDAQSSSPDQLSNSNSEDLS
jgi:stage V sporulation protein S